MTAVADFDVSGWINGEKSSSTSSDSFYPPLSVHIPDKGFDHSLSFASPLIVNESQSMTLQTPTNIQPLPFTFDTFKIDNTNSSMNQTDNNFPAFDNGLLNSSSSNIPPMVVDHFTAPLSPVSDASSPSDLDGDHYHPISPLSPSMTNRNDSTDYQSIEQIFEDDEHQSTVASPNSPASSEISAFSDSANSPTSSITFMNDVSSTTAPTKNQTKASSSKASIGGKNKRTKRRNLLNALKEHLSSNTNRPSNGEEVNTSESEADLMHELTNRSSRRGKRSAPSEEGDNNNDDKDDPESKRERNKQSASAYRKRRKMYLDTLENKVELLTEKLTEQQQSIAKMENENKVLREQVSFLKRLVSFKATNNNDEKKVVDDKSTISHSSGGFGATNSRLNLLNYSTAGTKNAGMFLFLLFSCFLLFNPMWSNDLAIHSDGSSIEPVGRLSRKLLSYEDFNDPLNALYPSGVKKEEYPFSTNFRSFSNHNIDTNQLSSPYSSAAAPDSSSSHRSLSSNNNDYLSSSSSSSSSSPSSSSSSTNLTDAARSKALAEFEAIAANFNMDPQSQQFAELVAAAYLPLVNILGEAATRAALQELATGVFFIQQQNMLVSATSGKNNSTGLPL